jgi:uncharacterized RDD family membrane protein YckC
MQVRRISVASDRLLQHRAQTTRLAGFVSRLAAFLIDLAIVTVVVTVTNAVSLWFGRTLELPDRTMFVLFVATLLVNGLFILAYYVGFVAAAGQTPGKRIMGMRIITATGDRPAAGRALRRFFGYFLSLPLFWGYLIVLVNDRRRAFHDKFAGTYVIYDR